MGVAYVETSLFKRLKELLDLDTGFREPVYLVGKKLCISDSSLYTVESGTGLKLANRPFFSCGSVTRPMSGSEAAGDLVLIETSLLFLCK